MTWDVKLGESTTMVEMKKTSNRWRKLAEKALKDDQPNVVVFKIMASVEAMDDAITILEEFEG